MMRFFCFILFVCACTACSPDGSRPKNILPPDSMKLVMFDVIEAQEYASIKYGRDTTAINSNLPTMLQQVFAIHKISRNDFYSSFNYYEAHPDINKALFDSISSFIDEKRLDVYRRVK